MGNYLLLAAFSVASFMAGVYVGARLAGRELPPEHFVLPMEINIQPLRRCDGWEWVEYGPRRGILPETRKFRCDDCYPWRWKPMVVKVPTADPVLDIRPRAGLRIEDDSGNAVYISSSILPSHHKKYITHGRGVASVRRRPRNRRTRED